MTPPERPRKQVSFEIFHPKIGPESTAPMIIRIGSILGAIPGKHLEYNDVPKSVIGVTFLPIITDQGGVGCKKIRQFSEFCCYESITVNEIYISSPDPTQQNAQFLHQKITDDRKLETRSYINIAFTQRQPDIKPPEYHTAKGNWFIDHRRFLEFFSYPGCKLKIELFYWENAMIIAPH